MDATLFQKELVIAVFAQHLFDKAVRRQNPSSGTISAQELKVQSRRRTEQGVCSCQQHLCWTH